MKLCELLNGIECKAVDGDVEKDIQNLAYDSRRIYPNSVFFAIEGYSYDGNRYIEEAVKNGAVAVVVGKPLERTGPVLDNITIIHVEDVRKTLAEASCQFYNNPSVHMQVIGVTGTKGKTSVTFMIRHILETAGIKTGIIGTVCAGYEGNFHSASRTTPESLEVQRLLFEMKENGCKAVVMEVSSQGLMQDRVHGVDFNIGVFTNIFPDHIGKGEHRDFNHYLECKSRLFDLCKRAVINGDDENWARIIRNEDLKQKIFYGEKEYFDFYYSKYEFLMQDNQLVLDFYVKAKEPFGDGQERKISLQTLGKFNIQNALAAVATTRALGIPWQVILDSLRTVCIPGRMEVVPLGREFTVIVDYAHNGKALENLLLSLRECKPKRLMLVFGCGGNRDANRRFQMGRIAYEMSDYIIVTSDNPRNEDPNDIINDITSVMEFCEKVILVISDRKEAIERAIMDGRKGDIIVIAGKGHETYQIIGEKIIYFDDKQVVLSCGKD